MCYQFRKDHNKQDLLFSEANISIKFNVQLKAVNIDMGFHIDEMCMLHDVTLFLIN